MYILLHSKDLPRGEYGFQVSHQIGGDRNTRYGKPEIVDCHSARSAMSYANGLVAGFHAGLARGDHRTIPILKTPTFEAQLHAELEEGA
jgi:hypothetical protein